VAIPAQALVLLSVRVAALVFGLAELPAFVLLVVELAEQAAHLSEEPLACQVAQLVQKHQKPNAPQSIYYP
jgi:hypothetical protein